MISLQTLKSHRVLPYIALLTMMLSLWSGFAAAEHHLDLDPHHHEEHNCQLFAASKQALASSFSVVESSFVLESLIAPEDTILITTNSVTACARSPPSTYL